MALTVLSRAECVRFTLQLWRLERLCVCVFSPIFNKVQGADLMEEKGKCEKVEDLNEVE